MKPVPFVVRIWFSIVTYFRILFDGEYAAKVMAGSVDREAPKLEEAPTAKKETPAPKKEAPAPPSTDAALQLLALMQREGRIVDFLEEDVASFSDADIGAAARVVHSGCRKALREHVKLEPVRSEEEGAKVTIEEGANPAEVKLTGNVSGKGPHTGTLRHRGWRVVDVKMPTAVSGHDARIVAQAEVEL